MTALSLSVDENNMAWQDALGRLDLPWSQGRLTEVASSGVCQVPSFWLLDPAGKIVAKPYSVNELAKELADRLK